MNNFCFLLHSIVVGQRGGFILGYQIPIINSVVHIVREESFYASNTIEHIVIVKELLREQENSADIEVLIEDLNKVYNNVQKCMPLLNQLENNALYGHHHPKFIYELTEECFGVLQKLCDTSIQFLQILGQLEGLCEKDLYLLIIQHITIEERYGLEVLSGYISQITGEGFRVAAY